MENDKLQKIEDKGFKRAVESKGAFMLSPYKMGTDENARFVKGYEAGVKSLEGQILEKNSFNSKDGFYPKN